MARSRNYETSRMHSRYGGHESWLTPLRIKRIPLEGEQRVCEGQQWEALPAPQPLESYVEGQDVSSFVWPW